MKNNLLLDLFSFGPYHLENSPAALHDSGHVESSRCKSCGKEVELSRDYSRSSYRLNTKRIIIPKTWNDIGVGIFHERVVEVLEKEQISGFRAYPMTWTNLDAWLEVAGPAARKLVFPTYYRIEILGRVDVNIYEVDNGEGSVCPECGCRIFGKSKSYTFSPKRLIPVPGTWDGSDFCQWRNLVHGASLCSRRVIDLAAKHGWNGCFGKPTPGVSVCSPIPPDWFERLAPEVRELHPDLF